MSDPIEVPKRRGRPPRSQALTPETLAKIVAEYEAGGTKQSALARKYNLASQSYVSRIVRRAKNAVLETVNKENHNA